MAYVEPCTFSPLYANIYLATFINKIRIEYEFERKTNRHQPFSPPFPGRTIFPVIICSLPPLVPLPFYPFPSYTLLPLRFPPTSLLYSPPPLIPIPHLLVYPAPNQSQPHDKFRLRLLMVDDLGRGKLEGGNGISEEMDHLSRSC